MASRRKGRPVRRLEAPPELESAKFNNGNQSTLLQWDDEANQTNGNSTFSCKLLLQHCFKRMPFAIYRATCQAAISIQLWSKDILVGKHNCVWEWTNIYQLLYNKICNKWNKFKEAAFLLGVYFPVSCFLWSVTLRLRFYLYPDLSTKLETHYTHWHWIFSAD